ncbi:MAG: metallophosphoesterase family protein [Bacteroidia bacterium]
MRRFAISDIHGCIKSFRKLIYDVLQLRPEDHLYLLGDYVDRGLGSRQVLDEIMGLIENGYQLTCLRGNHEVLMLDARDDLDSLDLWLYNGGDKTLRSFAVLNPGAIPERYWTFLAALSSYVLLDDYVLVHAGLNFSIPDPLSDLQEMVWIRDWYDDLDRAWLGDRTIVHGHTPIGRKEIRRMAARLAELPVLNIDGACVFQGDLCALDLDTKELFFQENIERI